MTVLPSPPSDARSEFAGLLRRFFAGRLTNDDFEDASLELCELDTAVFEVYWVGAWPSYSDNRVYRLSGSYALSRDQRRIVARWILFLKSNRPYSWPEYPHLPQWVFWAIFFLPIPTACLIGRWDVLALGFIVSIYLMALVESFFGKSKFSGFTKAGDFEAWPFTSKAEYKAALQNPPYLRGVDRRS